MSSSDEKIVKLLVRLFLFAKQPVKREELVEYINLHKTVDSSSSADHATTHRSRDFLIRILSLTDSALRSTFGYSIVDSSQAPQILSRTSSTTAPLSVAARKSSLQKSSTSQSSSKRYFKINTLSLQARSKFEQLHIDFAGQQLEHYGDSDDLDDSIASFQISSELHKFIVLSMIAFSRYSMLHSELVENIASIGVPGLSASLNDVLDELVKDKSLHSIKKESEQGTCEICYEWTARSLLEWGEEELVEILSMIFPSDQLDIKEKLKQSVKVQ